MKELAAKVLKIKEEIIVPDNCEVWDDQGNVINTSKIIIREKKKEYPKTYEECCRVLEIRSLGNGTDGYKWEILSTFQNLIICRDAYWKIAGEEMGFGKPWEPDYMDLEQTKFCIVVSRREVGKWETAVDNYIFAFPTREMRDAFYENFDTDLEICKEFL